MSAGGDKHWKALAGQEEIREANMVSKVSSKAIPLPPKLSCNGNSNGRIVIAIIGAQEDTEFCTGQCSLQQRTKHCRTHFCTVCSTSPTMDTHTVPSQKPRHSVCTPDTVCDWTLLTGHRIEHTEN